MLAHFEEPLYFLCHAAYGLDFATLIERTDADVPGLALPREVIDKVYYRNAVRVFGTAARD